jgi:hypothetical protein
MVRPRWHDALIITSIIAVLSFGAAAIWWNDVWAFLRSGDGSGTERGTTPVQPGKV